MYIWVFLFTCMVGEATLHPPKASGEELGLGLAISFLRFQGLEES